VQLDRADRGFSFMKEGPLDMRMDCRTTATAATLVNELSEQELGKIIREYGEERMWRTVARRIVDARCSA
jgi:16S rRNA (cytosine1402-N4)-methyltransferase